MIASTEAILEPNDEFPNLNYRELKRINLKGI